MDTSLIVMYIVIIAIVFVVIILAINMLKKISLKSKRNINLKDEAYNKIESTKSIAQILGKKGVKVGPAVAVLDKAQDLYNKGDYNGSLSLSEEARRILERSKLENAEIPKEERLETKKEDVKMNNEKEEDENLSASYQLQKKYPENYLAAKFSLEMAQNMYENSDEKKKILAIEYLKLARIAFDENNYSDSLKYSIKTQKILKEEIVEKKELKCPNCGVEVDPNDKFCWNCGFSLKVKKCPNCGAELRPNDKFCRSCGYKVV